MALTVIAERRGDAAVAAIFMVRSDGIVLTMLLCSANDISAICSIPTKNTNNEARTHLSLHKDAPISRAVLTVGRTLAVPVLGGLHHQYLRA
jgi:hypothetical protein